MTSKISGRCQDFLFTRAYDQSLPRPCRCLYASQLSHQAFWSMWAFWSLGRCLCFPVPPWFSEFSGIFPPFCHLVLDLGEQVQTLHEAVEGFLPALHPPLPAFTLGTWVIQLRSMGQSSGGDTMRCSWAPGICHNSPHIAITSLLKVRLVPSSSHISHDWKQHLLS